VHGPFVHQSCPNKRELSALITGLGGKLITRLPNKIEQKDLIIICDQTPGGGSEDAWVRQSPGLVKHFTWLLQCVSQLSVESDIEKPAG